MLLFVVRNSNSLASWLCDGQKMEQNMKKIIGWLLTLLMVWPALAESHRVARFYHVSSPDASMVLDIPVGSFSLSYGGNLLLQDSRVALYLNDGSKLTLGGRIVHTSHEESVVAPVDSLNPPMKFLADGFNVFRMEYECGYGIEWLVADKGMAYRWYVASSNDSVLPVDEEMIFSFPSDRIAYLPCAGNGNYRAGRRKSHSVVRLSEVTGEAACWPVSVDCDGQIVTIDASDRNWRIVSLSADNPAFSMPKADFGYPIDPVPFTNVKVCDDFWGQRLKASREVTIPLAFQKCDETGRYDNFVKAAHPSDAYKVGGFSFDDTDVYKAIEGAAYLLQTYPDKALEAYIDSILTIVEAAQEPDGYLYTARTMNPTHPHDWSGHARWIKEEDLSHELYNLGHMVESAIAYYQATGKRRYLDIAIRYADCVCREVGPNPGQACVVPGHQIAEMALAKLYSLTGERKYLDEAKFFLDYRGKTSIRTEYSQSHLPVSEQSEAVGHAVRASYMYAGIADVAALSGDTAYVAAIDRIWENIVGKKLYITGGIGATNRGEAFGRNYELPNMSAYCETCAAIGNVYVNYRMFLLHGLSKYFDVLERTLYNGLLSGVSMDGGGFFYPNPLESDGQHERQPWFGCACCPSNICRFIPSVPGYVYAVKDDRLYVNLFMANQAEMSVKGKKVQLEQITDYPWKGDVAIKVKHSAGQFTMKVRVPGWMRNQVVPSDLYRYADNLSPKWGLRLNGEELDAESYLSEDGYLTVDRRWKTGDMLELWSEMPARVVRAHPNVKADNGRVAIERGPVVYCAEWPDNDFSVRKILLNQQPRFEVVECKDSLNGLDKIRTDAQSLSFDESGKLVVKDVRLTLIPYYAWAHRGRGEMVVWIPQDLL